MYVMRIYIHVCKCMKVRVCLDMPYTDMSTHILLHVCIHIYIYIYTHMYTYICMYVCIYVYLRAIVYRY
jgi:hypothetical protein